MKKIKNKIQKVCNEKYGESERFSVKSAFIDSVIIKRSDELIELNLFIDKSTAARKSVNKDKFNNKVTLTDLFEKDNIYKFCFILLEKCTTYSKSEISRILRDDAIISKNTISDNNKEYLKIRIPLVLEQIKT